LMVGTNILVPLIIIFDMTSTAMTFPSMRNLNIH
jgi:hypothetical protein